MLRLIGLGVAIVLIVSGCGSNGAPTRHNDFTPLTSIEISADSPAIAAHSSTMLKVTGNFSGQFSRDITDQAVWSSDSPNVAEFITTGKPNRVTSHVPGTTILTATVGNVSNTFKLTVTSATVSALTITPVAPAVPKGLNTQFTVSGTFSDGTTQDLTFDSAWSSDTPAVATVSNDINSKGVAQALAVGTSTIRATFDGVNSTSLLTVTEVVLQSVAVIPTNPLLPANPSILSLSATSFKATGTYSDGSTADITSQAAWSSSRPEFATIATGGAATTLTPGTTIISASLAGISGTSNLKVTGGALSGISLSPANPKLTTTTLLRMTATGTFNNGSSRDITGVADWSVLDPSIATVTTPGGNLAWLNALASTPTLNPTTVSAAFKFGIVTMTGATNLTVTAPQLQSISINPTNLDLTVGTSSRFSVTATFNDATTQDVTLNSSWTSNSDATASAGNIGLAKGRVSGVAAGPVTISATYGDITVAVPITVTRRTIQSLVISGTPTVVSGNQVKFTTTANYSDGSSVDVTEDTTWSLDQPNIAILADSQNQPGQVVAVDTGSATLTASFGGQTQTMKLTVP